MTDQLTRTARQIRNAGRPTIHQLTSASTTPDGRLYLAACGRTLHNQRGAVLTTRAATCTECAEAAKPTTADLEGTDG